MVNGENRLAGLFYFPRKGDYLYPQIKTILQTIVSLNTTTEEYYSWYIMEGWNKIKLQITIRYNKRPTKEETTTTLYSQWLGIFLRYSDKLVLTSKSRWLEGLPMVILSPSDKAIPCVLLRIRTWPVIVPFSVLSMDKLARASSPDGLVSKMDIVEAKLDAYRINYGHTCLLTRNRNLRRWHHPV